MNCPEVYEHLPALVYDRLDPALRAEVEKHVVECSTCRRERAALERTRRLLDAPSTPEMCVDLPRLYREAAELDARRARRWRRAALTVTAAAAAAALVAVALRLEVRVEAHQVVMRWGTPSLPEPAPPDPSPPVRTASLAPEEMQRLAALEDQLRLVSQIVHALADSADTRDHQRRREITQLREQFEELRRQTVQRWTAACKYAETLFTAKLHQSLKGALQ